MTNFQPIKDKIWNSAKNDDKISFNKECDALMEKATGDWWRLGWNVPVSNIDELADLLKKISESAHKAWKEAIKIGDAPNEDISPGEGFHYCYSLVKKLIDENKKLKNEKENS